MIARFGEKINNPDSIAYWAWKNKIPIYCPPLTDGSIGDMLFFHSYKNPGLRCAPAPCAGSVGGCRVLYESSEYSLFSCKDCIRNGVAITARWEGGALTLLSASLTCPPPSHVLLCCRWPHRVDLVEDIRSINSFAMTAAPHKTGMVLLGGGEEGQETLRLCKCADRLAEGVKD